MKFFEMAQKRESCRNFKPIDVEKEKLIKCIEAARLAPSACNGQPWNFIVAVEPDAVKKTREFVQEIGMNKFTSECRAFIIIYDGSASASATIAGRIKRRDYTQIDTGIAAAHICYAAMDQGLSTCILGWLNEVKIKGYFNIPESKRVHLVIAVGYAEDKPLRNKSRKPMEDILKFV
ncbi:MAG: nitroreductase family protein [Eubacteriales bacterium]|nr:nitroreductase family protein [Eubacteriales bacterium]